MQELDRSAARKWGGCGSCWMWALLGLVLAPGAPLGLWLTLSWSGVAIPDEAIRAALIYSGVATAIVLGAFGWGMGRMIDHVRSASLHDGLTGLFNRRFLRESLPQMQAAAARRGEPLCIVMLDLDLFKQVNDSHGHLIGDQTLCAVSQALRDHSRKSDLIARYGGEEFAVLCPDTDYATGLQVAERLRAAIEALDETALGYPGPQTISVGVAVHSPDQQLSPEELLDHADTALYRAKHRGRNCCVAWRDGEGRSQLRSGLTPPRQSASVIE
ncbi:diguanylate cyclase/phosphodiesterase [Enhygromyxa salina]|uniref:diguanylate cyclase n=1 Tax=Enhygromyxa salina TaxID=215803 RepID=A0A0C2D165_9BACT|nr:GGDEF domain-containing protein [Enhygromyxa salina]KIG16971.1 diguanylate cyclase/phosphodiesterase [Enhygromyxa salina]